MNMHPRTELLCREHVFMKHPGKGQLCWGDTTLHI